MKSKRIIVMLLLIVIMIGLTTISNAALESRPGKNSWHSTANEQFINIRAMEKSGETLGLNATINETTYLDSTGNGLDVHMALATEWGTAAMLAVSDYGNFNTTGTLADKGTNQAATTGNITGIYQMADNVPEYVAGVFKNSSNSFSSKIYSADSRYRNEYTSTNSEYHKGDAIYQTKGWYGGKCDYVWNIVFSRENGLFSYRTSNGDRNCNGIAHYPRAAITCAEGL